MRMALGNRVRVDVGRGAEDDYRAEWQPYVSTTEKEARVYIMKAAVPGQRLMPKTAKMLIESVADPRAEDFDDRLTVAVDRATRRASTMSTTQNAVNQYNVGVMLSRRWKWVFGIGLIIGMALPNIPVIPII